LVDGGLSLTLPALIAASRATPAVAIARTRALALSAAMWSGGRTAVTRDCGD
jgi:hypothetical protein